MVRCITKWIRMRNRHRPTPRKQRRRRRTVGAAGGCVRSIPNNTEVSCVTFQKEKTWVWFLAWQIAWDPLFDSLTCSSYRVWTLSEWMSHNSRNFLKPCLNPKLFLLNCHHGRWDSQSGSHVSNSQFTKCSPYLWRQSQSYIVPYYQKQFRTWSWWSHSNILEGWRYVHKMIYKF